MLFCKLVTLILGWNCVKDLTVTKIVKLIKFEGTWGDLEAKNCFGKHGKNIWENSSFHMK